MLEKDLIVFTVHSKTRAIWDSKTLAAFRPNTLGYAAEKYIPIRKVILLGILTHHPTHHLRYRLLDQVQKDLSSIGVTTPRKNCRTDELLFDLMATRR